MKLNKYFLHVQDVMHFVYVFAWRKASDSTVLLLQLVERLLHLVEMLLPVVPENK